MSIEKTVQALEANRRTAMLDADVERLGDLFADDLRWIHATARVDTKEGLLDSIGSGSTKYLAMRAEDETVRVVDSVALISGVMTMTLEVKGVVKDMQNRFTIVWAPFEDTYKAANWQSTPVPQS